MTTSTSRTRVLLADDHRMMVECLRGLLATEFDVVGVVEDGIALVEAVLRLRPDVVIADISMPRLNGIDALVQLRERHPEVKVVFLTMHNDPSYARRAFKVGAMGFVLKHSAPAELVTAVRMALDGETYLSPAIETEVLQAAGGQSGCLGDLVARLTTRQRAVLQLLAEGRSAKEIGNALSISARTVEFHKSRMMDTIGVRSSGELLHFAIKNGIVTI